MHLLNLDRHDISHLVCFSNTKSYCLLQNLCSGEVALLLEHSAGLPRVPLLCWQVQVRLEQPLPLDRGTAQTFFSCFPLSNHNPEVSHSESALSSALGRKGTCGHPWLSSYGSNVLSFGLEVSISFLVLNLLMSFSIKLLFKARVSVTTQCPQHAPWGARWRGKRGVKSRALLPAGDTGVCQMWLLHFPRQTSP